MKLELVLSQYQKEVPMFRAKTHSVFTQPAGVLGGAVSPLMGPGSAQKIRHVTSILVSRMQ